MLPVFPDVYLVLGSFLITISSTDLALLPALIVLRTLANYSSSLWKVFSVLLSFFLIFNNNIHYIFPEICDLPGNF